MIWILAGMLLAGAAGAAEFHVATNGAPTGCGSVAAPWDLATALAHPAAVRAGDTIWLHGGTYRGAFTSVLSGSAAAPVTVRQAAGERAIIDAKPREGETESLFTVSGSNVVWWGFEMTCSDTQRVTALPGPWAEDMRRGGPNCRGANMKFVNLLIHDTGGPGFWSDGAGGEFSGCLIYFNGWIGPDRGHGHGIYAQNRDGTKLLADNILFANFSYGIHCYGSATAPLAGFELAGNVAFNNGAPAGDPTPGLFVGGGCRAERIVVRDNFTYGPSSALQLGFSWGPQNADATVANNLLCGTRVHMLFWDAMTFTNNTIIAPHDLATIEFPPGVTNSPHWHWNANRYFCTNWLWSPFAVVGDSNTAAYTFTGWQQALGYDTASAYQETRPTGTRVFVRPNRYEPGRAHIIVYNWDRFANVSLDLSGLLTTGQAFQIVNAQNFHGPPLVTNTWTGPPITLPMAPTPLAMPVGMPNCPLPVTQPEFGVFVLLPGPLPLTFEQWKTNHGLPANTPFDSDADRDGLALLLEYALERNPTTPDATGSTAFAGDGSFQFQRARSELVYEVQSSTNLVHWSPVVVNPGNVGENISVPSPFAPSTPAGFLRLKVTRP